MGGRNDLLDLDEEASSYLVDAPVVTGASPALPE